MKIFVSALEPSSNLHLSNLLKYLPKDVEFIGAFSEEMIGQKPLFDMREFSIMGIKEVLKKIKIFKIMQKELINLALSADKILLMDSSSFNIKIAKEVKKQDRGIPIYYYILPQIWAWKRYRAKVLEKYCDYLCAILPFELQYYKNAKKLDIKEALNSENAPSNEGANAIYVGNPLIDEMPEIEEINGGLEKKIVFMPGSRKSEIRRLFPLFSDLAEYFVGYELILVVPKYLENDLDIYGDGITKFSTTTDAISALKNATFAYICSGTATLQAGLLGVDFTLCYKTNYFDFFLLSLLLNVDNIGLMNIIFKNGGLSTSNVHSELIQYFCDKKYLLRAFSQKDHKRARQNAIKLREYLRFGSSANMAMLLNNAK